MLSRRQRHSGERGQALVIALAFIAFFSVTALAVLGVADLPGRQHVLTEGTAQADSDVEAGAAYAAADAGRRDLALTCLPGNSGTLTMQNSRHVATYTVNSCNPSGSSSTGEGGQNCLLCLLNLASGTPSTQTVVYNANRPVTTTGGSVYINGGIAAGGHLTASSAGIFVYADASHPTGNYPRNCCTPEPTPYAPYILDPYRVDGPSPLEPPPVPPAPAGCTSLTSAGACSQTVSSPGNYTVNPGLWAALSISGQANVTFNPGTYVFSGRLSIGGQATVSGSGVTFFLACSGSSGQDCPSSSGRTGGYIEISGSATAVFTAPAAGQPYSGIVVLSDPNLLDPGGTAGCLTNGSSCLLSIAGNGASFTGTQDLRLGGVSIQGNAGETIAAGRLIANSLYIRVTGNTTGLNLSGAGTVSMSTCTVFDDSVNSNAGGGTGQGTGRAIVQSQCGTAKGVIAFNYIP